MYSLLLCPPLAWVQDNLPPAWAPPWSQLSFVEVFIQIRQKLYPCKISTACDHIISFLLASLVAITIAYSPVKLCVSIFDSQVHSSIPQIESVKIQFHESIASKWYISSERNHQTSQLSLSFIVTGSRLHRVNCLHNSIRYVCL